MANIILYPPYGTREEANSLKFEISDIEIDNFNIDVEDATHNSKISIKCLDSKEKGTYSGVMNLDIPEYSSHSSISIFVHIDELQKDGSYKTVQILPTIFNIKEEADTVSKDFVLFPSYSGQKDLISIKVDGKPNSKRIFSVNDKIFKILINEEGKGSFHFKGEDVVGKEELSSVNKLSVYEYKEEDNFTKKTFTGSYLNILPSTIALHAEIDPRCDPTDANYIDPPGSWVRGSECDDENCDPTKEVCCDPQTEDCECNPDLEDCAGGLLEVCTPPIDIPVTCNSGSVKINTTKPCRIHNNSVVMLNNGMALHAYTSPDKSITDSEDDRFNINRVFLAAQKTATDVQIIVNRDVIVESKTLEEDFIIHIERDVASSLSTIGDLESSDVYIVLYNDFIGFSKIKIIGVIIDEYTGEDILIGDGDSVPIALDDWLFCVNSVIFHNTVGQFVPSTYLFGESGKYTLAYVRDPYETGAYSQPVNISISTNEEYIGNEEEIYVYFVVEAVTENGLSQLYFNSLSLGNDVSFSSEELGWIKLTDENQGNNRNPKSKMDTYNNLHVVFESDRGDLTQLYYGVVGLNSRPNAASSFSSSIDKYSEFLSKTDKPFDYFLPLLVKEAEGNEYVNIPEYDTESLISGGWDIFQDGGGVVSASASASYLDDLRIESNAVYQEALALANLPMSLEVNPSVPYPYVQFNYQISFGMNAEVIQTSSLPDLNVVNDIEMDILFKQWKDGYTVVIDENSSNIPIYSDGVNKFVIERQDNIYDRIVPIVGSYNHQDPSAGTNIKILKDDSNLKDFTFALMFEKTYFRASNIYSEAESQLLDIDGYVQEEIETIYTGKAKLVAFIKTEEKSSERADYIIVREFPDALEVNESSQYDIVVNYAKINSEEVENALNTDSNIYVNKYIGTVTLLIDGVPRFSQSYISTLEDEFNLDIGFGVPDGGYYIADKMTPSKLGVFDNISSIINFSNILITSPTYTYNSDVVSMPSRLRDMTKLKVLSEEEVLVPSNTIPYESTFSDNNLLSLNFIEKEQIKYYVSHIETNSLDYSEQFNVSQIEKISIEFATYDKTDRMTVTKKDGTVLYDTGFILSTSLDLFKFDVDVTYIDKVYINVELGPDADNFSYEFTAYFKKVINDNSFSQVPITFEGINQSADTALGICNDLHIAWQSNRDKQWDIYYMNSVDELTPFRYETQITDTESNSLRPSISVGRNQTRMIVWNDNREGDFNIYAARSIEDFGCCQKACETKMAEAWGDSITQCTISFDFIPSVDGYYKFVLYFYSRSCLTGLYKAIALEDCIENSTGEWLIDGVAIEDSLSYDGDVLLGVDLTAGDTVTISYVPDKNDKIFDVVLYVKLVSILSEG